MKFLCLILSLNLFLHSCSSNHSTSNSKPKNVIFIIGDGMGPGQVSLLYYFLKNTKIKKIKDIEYAFDKLDQTSFGISQTGPHGNIIVDSACSATQLATGQPARSEMIGLDINGDPVETILEMAAKEGLSTGLVSDTRMTHATPASFGSHVANRWQEDEIAAGYFDSQPDVLMSGGANRFVPKGYTKRLSNHFVVKSRRKDNRNLLQEAIKKNYQVIHSKDELYNLDQSKKLLGLFTNHSYPDAIWFTQNKEKKDRKIPTLLEMSQVAIKKLSQNKKGFFLMIEAGQIDWAAHQNDTATMLHEMLSMNETLNWVVEWVEKNPDTLLVVTADHETGGFGLGYNVHDIPKAKSLPGSAFKDQSFKVGYNYGQQQTIDKIYNQKMSLLNLWKDFTNLPVKSQTPNRMRQMVKQVTGYTISTRDAKKILASEPNKFYKHDHRSLNVKVIPKVEDYKEYYHTPSNIRTALIARVIAARQSVVWGTGGHTAAPVHVYSKGPGSKMFSGQLTHPQLGKRLQKSLGF